MADDAAAAGGPIDLLCAGRLGIDLYGTEHGAGLAEVGHLRKYVGGSAANACVGAARLGLRTAMCSRVGDEPFGDFCRSLLAREGVDVSLLQVDPERLTGMVALAIRPSEDFPRIFFYRDSADLAAERSGVDFDVVSRARAVLVTGSYLTTAGLRDLSHALAGTVAAAGGRVILDLDYRPVLWGAAPIRCGAEMAAPSAAATAAVREILPLCDLVVGTEAELSVASGEGDAEQALRTIASLSSATIVVKHGASGASAYTAAELAAAEGPLDMVGTHAHGYAVVVESTVGAGDGFMSGFVSGWLRDKPLGECLRLGNANGAIVASRHGCMEAMAFAGELASFVSRGGVPLPDGDEELERLHRVGTRRPDPARLFVLAVDHRWQLEELAEGAGRSAGAVAELKNLLGEAFAEVAAERSDVGLLIDAQYGADVLERFSGSAAWLFRTLERARSHPVELIGDPDPYGELRSWPAGTTAKVLALIDDDDPRELTAVQAGRLAELSRVCRATGRELLVELSTPRAGSYRRGELAGIVSMLYRAGVCPEWWKLPAIADPAEWSAVGEAARTHDPTCRGLLALGAAADLDQLAGGFAACASEPLGRGFAVGRTIFGRPAAAWLRGETSDDELRSAVVAHYLATIALWEAESP